MPVQRQVVGTFVLALLMETCAVAQRKPADSGPRNGRSIYLKSRTITPDESAKSDWAKVLKQASKTSRGGRVHVIAQIENGPLNLLLLAARGIHILGYIPDNAVVISAPLGAELTGLGLGWIGAVKAADRQGLSAQLAADNSPSTGYYVIEFYPDVDMGDARALVLGERMLIQDNPYLLTKQLLVQASADQLAALATQDIVAFLFPASPELVQGLPITPCVDGATSYGPVMAMAAGLTTGGWTSLDPSGQVNLTYTLGPLTPLIPSDTILSLFQQAQLQWTSYVNVAFTPGSDRSGGRNVDLAFYSGAHGDAYPFVAKGSVLAHTFYPAPPNAEPIAGDMHLNLDETWTNGGNVGTDFYSVALHELGHALGLVHTSNPADVMYPFYRNNKTPSSTDISALQSLYPSRTVAIPGVPPPPAAAPPLTLTIQSPAAQVTTAAIALSGTTSGGVGAVQVTWSTDRGAVGTASGTTAWSVPSLTLAVGTNTITVQAMDADRNHATQTVSVVRVDPTPPAPPVIAQLPVIQIVSPSTMSVSTSSMTIDVKGTASDPAGIKSVSWTVGGLSGVAQGTSSWDTGLIGLQSGANTITITAVALDGGSTSVTLQVTATPLPVTVPSGGGGSGDTTPPTMTVASPATTSVFTSDSSITISGAATDNVGVAVVRWETVLTTGVATGTTQWVAGPIPLMVGMNNIVIRAYDSAGNQSWRSISVTRQ